MLTRRDLNKLGKKQFPKLFEPLILKNTAIKNRLYFPPLGIDCANTDGSMSYELENFYLDIAKGGCGLVILSNSAISPDSLLGKRGLRIYNRNYMYGYKRLVKQIKELGSVPGIQLQHFGRQGVTALTQKTLLAPSAIPCLVTSKKDPNYRIKAMNKFDIIQVKNDFARAAELCCEAGFQYIQLHAGNGYLLNNFLSPYTNYREDEYGGSIENRARFIVEVIEAVRERIGNDIILSIRVNADDCVETKERLKPRQHRIIIPMLEQAGVDLITLTTCISEQVNKLLYRTPEHISWLWKTISKVKQFASVPLGFSGFTADLDTAESLISRGMTDLVGMGRALFADNDLIHKTITGHKKDIHNCLWDGTCFKDKYNPEFNRVYCCVNPKYKRPGQAEQVKSKQNNTRGTRMKILAINSSYRKDKGFTHHFVSKIFEGAREAGAECEELLLAKYDIKQCIACKKCQTPGDNYLKCIFRDKDDVHEIVKKIRAADLLILAFPSYYHSPPSLLMKLIERYYSYADTSKAMISRHGKLIYETDDKLLGKPYVLSMVSENIEDDTFKTSISYFKTLDKFYESKNVGILYRNAIFMAQLDPEWDKNPIFKEILAFYREAGKELATYGYITKKTQKKVTQEIIPMPDFDRLKDEWWFKEAWVEQVKAAVGGDDSTDTTKKNSHGKDGKKIEKLQGQINDLANQLKTLTEQLSNLS